uniref:Lck interacting transmembrane adaptor 1 n=1 Tax=Ursus maritimus TaxID=29073 RepID=A0A452VAJ2_URSMA
MGPQVPSAPPAFWILGCLALFLWLWTLCTACHRYTLAPRKQVQRQQARPRGGAMPVEAVSARLSPGPGWDQHRTDQPSLPPVTAERTPRLHPQQVGHQTARAAPRPQWLQSPEACQHGYPAPTMAGGVQRHQQTSGSLLTLGTALGNAHCHLTLHLPGGHLFQCGAGCNPQSQPGSQPCGTRGGNRSGPPKPGSGEGRADPSCSGKPEWMG